MNLTDRAGNNAGRRRPLPVALLLAFALFAAACGSDDSAAVNAEEPAAPATAEAAEAPVAEPTETPEAEPTKAPEPEPTKAPEPEPTEAPEPVDTGFPVSIDIYGTEVVVPARPERILSLSPTATEMLFAIGAGDRVIAVDSLSDYPADAPITDLSAFEPNVEAILAFEPDLVVLSFDPGDIGPSLAGAGVPMLTLGGAANIAESYSQIERLGAATGHIGDAAEVVLQIQTDLADLAASVPDRDVPLTYYHELDDTLYSITSATFIGELYALAGLVNAADAADPDGEFFGYPQVSAEFLIDADPDLIFLADTKCCGQNGETVAGRPGWDTMSAVQASKVIELDDDIASRWGPRIVDLLQVIVDATASVEVSS